MINVENLQKSYGAQSLFDGVSFKISQRERVGLVGRNGHGKTTLFKILIGREDYEGGNITYPKNYRIGHVSQQLTFTKNTILDEGMLGLQPTEKDHHWKVEKILFGLGFTQDDLARSPLEFSGGYQVRLNLAKILVSEPDLLLLDEPTNYLDITSIRWIEQFLLSWPHELMLITHDRSFMDKIVTHTVGIHRKKARKIAGNTEKYYSQIAQDEEVYEKTRLNDERREKEIRLFISRFRAKARLANMVQSRIKTLAKMEKKDELSRMKNLEFSFRHSPLRAKHIMTAEDITFGYNAHNPLIKGLNFTVNSGDRICVIGKNGKGKTTLLKLIGAKFSPQSGSFSFNPGVITGFYEQTNIQSLVDSRTVEDEIHYSHPDVDRQMARNICGAMLFEGDAALKKITSLSGGEKSRVMLGKLLAQPLNLLLLDEPTNHLDMESCDALLAAIDDFEGTVIMVTHNEMFLHALADRLIVFHNDSVDIFEGSYQRFLESGGWQDHDPSPPLVEEISSEKASLSKLTKKELRKLRSEINIKRAKMIKPLDDRIAALEKKIEKEETHLDTLNQEMLSVSLAQDGPGIAQVSQKIHKYQSAIEKGYQELEELYFRKENEDVVFQKRLAELNE
jgi:ATP-binding cassette, subfamily F, member 3